ncbi:hypothetical protein SLS55_001028 [Diplodia seriata]|uniref:Uncharacterized protein n=1 Tax=Diplodia seriata TaxID=420778 RepID=A0ABR3CX11_9PEZI
MKKRLKRKYKSSNGYNRIFRKQFLKDFVKENYSIIRKKVLDFSINLETIDKIYEKDRRKPSSALKTAIKNEAAAPAKEEGFIEQLTALSSALKHLSDTDIDKIGEQLKNFAISNSLTFTS